MMSEPLLKQAKRPRIIACCLMGASFCVMPLSWAKVSQTQTKVLSKTPPKASPQTPQNEDKLPILIRSEKAEFDDKTSQFTYHGKVVATQGKRTLRGDTLIIHENKSHQVDKILALGKPAFFEASMPDKPLFNGQAHAIEYFPNENKIIFLNNATLEQMPYAITGSRLVYLLDSHNLFSESLVSEEKENHPRTQITIASSKKESL